MACGIDLVSVLRLRCEHGLALGGLAFVATLVGCPGGTDLDDGTTGTNTTGTGTTAATGSGDASTSFDPTVSADTTDGTTHFSSDGHPGCDLSPVDEAIVDQLFIYGTGFGAGAGSVPVGSTTPLSLAWIDAGFPTMVEACVDWSVEPGNIDVAIGDEGTLIVGDMVRDGTVLTVTADLENGRRIITTELTVYVPLQYDIIGGWTEVQQLPCDGSPAITPDPILGELIFDDTGEFTVTWTPFEVYIDYWGTYTYDPATGALSLTVRGGNYVPPDVDGEGTAMVMGGQLVLQDMWLGMAQEPVTPVACGHVFE